MTSAARIAGSACLLAAMLPTSCAIADAQPAAALRSFYVQSQLEAGEQIVEVSQQGRDVRVRTITMVQAHDQCPGVVVRAYDLALTNTTVQAVAGTSLCSIAEQRFNRAVGGARDTTKHTIDWFGWRGSVVEFAYRDACWDADRNRTVRCEPNYFAWRLEGYTGPPAQRGPLPLRLVDHEKWQFVHYMPPVFPPIALSARVFGDVHLRLEVDSVSGAVTRATVAKSIPLLDASALAAAVKWRFVPGSTPGGPFDVAIQFQVECPGSARAQR